MMAVTSSFRSSSPARIRTRCQLAYPMYIRLCICMGLFVVASVGAVTRRERVLPCPRETWLCRTAVLLLCCLVSRGHVVAVVVTICSMLPGVVVPGHRRPCRRSTLPQAATAAAAAAAASNKVHLGRRPGPLHHSHGAAKDA